MLQLGATLDRNGLRPARFLKTKEGLIGFMSETGVIEVDDSEVELKGRLGPGNMITVDLETGRFRQNFEIKQELAKEAPYGEWLEKHRCTPTLHKPEMLDAPIPCLLSRYPQSPNHLLLR